MIYWKCRQRGCISCNLKVDEKMFRIKEYVKASSLEQAYELNQKRANRIIGGMLWMKMGKGKIHTAIDLSGLGLDTIEETEKEFIIGCMVTLRQLELHASLAALGNGILRESVKNIVGVQFRNLATVGGSLFGRFGFSDVLTAFLALDTEVELYRGGRVPLAEFAGRKPDNDILVRVIVKKDDVRRVYLSHRNSRTDFPVLAVAIAAGKDDIKVIAGARPHRAIIVPAEGICIETGKLAEDIHTGVCSEKAIREYAARLSERIPTGSNMRASAEYRSHLAEILIRRGLSALNESAKEERGL